VAGVLAVSFGLYGLVRKVAAIDALGGLFVETLLLAPIAAVLLTLAAGQGTAAWGRDGTTDLLLALAGAVTAAPLLMFAAAARRLPLSVLGLLQYLSPSIQFAEAVLIFGEPLRPMHGLTFGLIWTGCAVFAWDGLRERGRKP
jgi:chloramphenicol-sensitive protein RarD